LRKVERERAREKEKKGFERRRAWRGRRS